MRVEQSCHTAYLNISQSHWPSWLPRLFVNLQREIRACISTAWWLLRKNNLAAFRSTCNLNDLVRYRNSRPNTSSWNSSGVSLTRLWAKLYSSPKIWCNRSMQLVLRGSSRCATSSAVVIQVFEHAKQKHSSELSNLSWLASQLRFASTSKTFKYTLQNSHWNPCGFPRDSKAGKHGDRQAA